jgi:hypothetical protein
MKEKGDYGKIVSMYLSAACREAEPAYSGAILGDWRTALD